MGIYVGEMKSGKMHIFESNKHPCIQTHGDLYINITGPFHSVLGADYFAKFSKGEILTIKEAEQLGYKYAIIHTTKAVNSIDENLKPALKYRQFYFCNKCLRQLKRSKGDTKRDKQRGTKRRCPNPKCLKNYYEYVYCHTCKKYNRVLFGSGGELRCIKCTMQLHKEV